MAGLFNLNNKLLAQYHRISRHAVNRICAKHGIVRDKFGRVNIDRLKIFQDALFGVTVSGIAGMISSTFSALALRSNARPFSELIFGVDSLVEQTIDPFLAQLRPLAQAREPWSVVAYERKEIEQEFLLYWLNAMEARRNPDSEVHLFMSQPTRLPLNSTAFKDWLAAHPQFRAYYAPKIVHMSWFKFIFRCFTLIAKLPVQAELMGNTKRLTDELTGYADEHPREPFYSVL